MSKLHNDHGLLTCSRYAYPPNSLSLCGPDKQKNLAAYSQSEYTDLGTKEILTQFSTLFPYLSLIAYHNSIKDPFSERVVKAYWIGNTLLRSIPLSVFADHVFETLGVKKRLKPKEYHSLSRKLSISTLPHHAFHVLNVYKRTGHTNSYHEVATMDACIINWGIVQKITQTFLLVKTRPLRYQQDVLTFTQEIVRKIFFQGTNDLVSKKVKIGDKISYHWGYFCDILSVTDVKNLSYYTSLAVESANKKI